MDLLKAELDRKRKRTSELVAKAGGEKGGRRFVRRGEEERLKQQERERKQAELVRLREEKKRKREEEEQRLEEEERKRREKISPSARDEKTRESAVATKGDKSAEEASTKDETKAPESGEQVSEREAKTRLRAMGLPVTMFGETKEERLARLLQAEEDKGHHHDDFNLTDGHNVNNEFLGNVGTDLTGSHLDVATGRDEEDAGADGKEADSDDDDDEDDDNEGAGSRALRQAEGGKGAETEGGAGPAKDGGGTGVAGVGTEVASGGDESTIKGEQNRDAKELEPNKLVRTFLRGLLKDWEMDLNARPDHVKRTVQGKLETKTQKQAKDYMRPLFKLCKKKELPDGILNNLVTMINYMKEGEFVKANDVYILTAIGNAPWPIGLTMVGIHERSGRERISSKNVAHIMNNEAQRKYLVSVKRLMTYLQDKRTDIAPSKKVR